jgi:hypothetical protein
MLMAVEVVHGTLRAIFLVPVVGDLCARRIGVLIGSLLILIVCFLTIGWVGVVRTRSLIRVGLSWLALTVGFELGLGRFVFGYSWGRIASDYDLLHGGLMPIGLAVLALSPIVTARLRSRLFGG